MKIQINGASFMVDWEYRGTSTICVVSDGNTRLWSAPAVCHPSDRFSYEAGRKLTLARVLKGMPLGKAGRKLVWQTYFGRLPEHKRPKKGV